MHLSSLHELFLHELKDLYDAEHQILEALPAIAEAASSPELKAAFEAHLEETEAQVERLKEIFGMMDQEPKREHCAGMKGLIEEGKKVLKEAEKAVPEVLDCALIGAAQRVEHYEIAGYGTARALAQVMGHDEVAELLSQTLDEESDTDESLTELAEDMINPAAMEVASGME